MNELSQAESLYLQQHASNPVHWKMWSNEAFIKAKSDHKPVLVSIGYAACHWCHVMEHESFEDEAVAAFMNKHFVCIKVDREEHPEVDHLYMDALIAMTHQGGWPLNMFVTPDRKPFYGGTYFPPERMYGRASWMEVLQSIQKYWTEQQEEIQMQATQLLQHLSQANTSLSLPENEVAFNPALVYQNIMLQADEAQGGFGKAPKFPATHTMNYLLVDSFLHQREEGVHHVYFTIQKMLHSGIYDAVGGGLCRYAVDDDWMIPHFEKMLYDNALFLSLLSNMYRLKPMESLKEGIKGILKWCTDNWKDTDGLYCSASDADSENVEGKYYVWTYAELLTLITAEEEILFEYYQILPEGNWEKGFSILHASETTIQFCERKSIEHTYFLSLKHSFLQKLFKQRKDRVAPAIDTKKQLSWNALYSIALCDAFSALQIDSCAEEAVEHMETMLSHFWRDGYLLHLNYGYKQLIANADDWAYLIKALLRLATTTQISRYLKEAARILEWGHTRYYSEDEQMYYFSDKVKQDVLVRKIDTHDNALPSVNAVMADNLLVLGIATKRASWVSLSTTINAKMQSMVQRYPGSFANAASNLILEDLLKVVEVDNVSSLSWIAGFQRAYNPDVVLLPSQNILEKQTERDNQEQAIEKSSILVCTKYACYIPDTPLSMRFEKYC